MKRQLNLGLIEAFEGILGYIIVNYLINGMFPAYSPYFHALAFAIALIGIFTMPSATFFYLIGWCGWAAYLLLQGGALDIINVSAIIFSWLLWVYINVIRE